MPVGSPRACKPDCVCGRHSAKAKAWAKELGHTHKGKVHTLEARANMSEGLRQWNATREISDETRAKLATMKGKKIPMVGHALEHRQKSIAENRKKSRFYNTSLERAVRKALEDAGIEFKWQQRVGRWTVDFLVGDMVIEANGCYWHACKKCEIKDTRRMRFKDYRRHRSILCQGYKLLVLWEHDTPLFPQIVADTFGQPGAAQAGV